MTSFDTNILLYAFSRASPFHDRARVFLEDLTPRDDIAVSELVLPRTEPFVPTMRGQGLGVGTLVLPRAPLPPSPEASHRQPSQSPRSIDIVLMAMYK